MKQLITLYTETYGIAPKHIAQLPKAGSNRTYYRLYDEKGDSVIGVVGTSYEENNAFVTMADEFLSLEILGNELVEVCHFIQDGLVGLQGLLDSRY